MAKKKTSKKKITKKTVKSSKRGALPTAVDKGFKPIRSSEIGVMSIASLNIFTGKSIAAIRQRLITLAPDMVGNSINGGKYYDPKKALPLIYEKDFIKTSKKKDPEDRVNDPTFRKNMALAEKAEIELAEQKKEVVRVDDIIEQVAEEYALLRQRLLAIPARTAKRILLVENEKEALDMLKDEINKALNELNADAEKKLKAIKRKAK